MKKIIFYQVYIEIKSDNNNLMIQLNDVFCVMFVYIGSSISNYKKWLIVLSEIQLSGGQTLIS